MKNKNYSCSSKVFLLIALLCCVSTSSFAYDFKAENDGVTIYYDYINNKTEAEVTYESYGCYSGVVNIPATVTVDEKTLKVTSIGFWAFWNSKDLTSVTIPNTVKSIDGQAFRNCSSLTSVTIGDSVASIGSNTFEGCSSLTSITIPNSVTSLGGGAFCDCSSLASVTIGNSVTSISNSVFSGCSSLTSITIPDKVTSIGNYAFYNCSSLTSVTIPNSVTSIGSYAFDGCSSLTSVTIPNSVTSIGSAFLGCSNVETLILEDGDAVLNLSSGSSLPSSIKKLHLGRNLSGTILSFGKNLTEATIGPKVTSIKDRFFYGCSSLTSIIIPDNVTSIGDWTFLNCTGLTSIIIPNSVTSMGECAFCDCSSLASVTIGNSVTSIGSSAFSGCSSLTSITIGNSVTSISNSAFYGCSSLTSITIPDKVTSIGNNAFYGCSRLTAVTIGNSVTSIGSGAFEGCSSLTSIKIPKSVTSIGSWAFSICTSLTKVIVEDIAAWCGINFGGTSANPLEYAHRLYSDENTEIRDLKIPDSVTSIGGRTFRYFSYMTSIKIPKSVTSIANSAFDGCTNLRKVIVEDITAWCGISFGNEYSNPLKNAEHLYSDEKTEIKDLKIPDSVTSIADYAFYGGSNLTSIKFPKSVTSIGTSSFYGCSGLRKVIVEDIAVWCGISFVGNYHNPLFYAKHLYSDENTEIKDLEIPNSVTCIGDYTFQYCSGLKSITIPNSVTSIGNYAFYECSSLTSITIPNSVTSIGNYAFYECSSLTSTTIPNSVTSIGNRAFWFCSGLNTVTIGENVKDIGSYAFYGCSALGKLITLCVTPPICDSYALTSINKKKCTLYVPKNTIAEYKIAKQWKDFLLIEEGAPTSISMPGSNGTNTIITRYDTNGHVIDKPTKGLNIVKMSDGTIKKVMVK